MSNKLKRVALTMAGLLFILKSLDARLSIHYTTLKHDTIQEGLRIVFLSDLHGNSYGEQYGRLMSPLEELRADIILLGGDIFDVHRNHTQSWEFLEQLSKRYYNKIYMIQGNHEVAKGFSDLEKAKLENLGIHLVGGQTVNIDIRNQTIQLTGLDDREDWYHTLDEVQRNQEHNKAHENTYKILLAHRPSHINEYLQGGYHLILAGHTHGGQIRVPYILNGLYTSDQGWFPKYTGGWYEFERYDTKFLVGRGLEHKPRLIPRVFNRTEMHIIDLEGTTNTDTQIIELNTNKD